MTIYIDDSARQHNGVDCCHMMTDDNIESLHLFAEKIGLGYSYFTNNIGSPHYDVPNEKHQLAITLGAIPVEQMELLQKCVPRLAHFLKLKQTVGREPTDAEIDELQEEFKRKGIPPR